ncbi:MAG TPA: hypothetical protein VMV87_05370 [Burkholderiales bacterium]|nr:hypothetical protein [Burkholderiales bacterium]
MHRLAAGVERMAAVELERFPAVVVLVALVSGEHLESAQASARA